MAKEKEKDKSLATWDAINTCDALADQITALLNLMQAADVTVDRKSVRSAAEMCMTMFDELMEEVNKLSEAAKAALHE